MTQPALPGFDRLLAVCRQASLEMLLTPPARHPLREGHRVAGHVLDPLLAAFYARSGSARFAEDVYLLRVNEEENQLEEKNQWWRESWQERLGLSVCVFGGEASLAYYFATVPGLADARGCQPVVEVSTYELDGPAVMPLASTVDRFFDLYARYLEALVSHEDYAERGYAALGFPWQVPHLVARDEHLVRLIEEGRFDFPQAGHEARAWALRVIEAHRLIM
ncbi:MULTISPECIES: hypothetical protein [Myxococcus]|uniref:hypothetical protein n=1 Tax=Myxococcus TaxID=32 RepID=UPI0011428562|nr:MULTISPECIES: hypothetical protein [Myxococcus]MCK8496905.1 hypothetical protein [Myxococcus fulvus]